MGKICLPDVFVEHVITRFIGHLNDQNLPITFGALDGQIPIGMCSLRKSEGIRPDLTPWLGSLVVDAKYQKQGIGKMMIYVALQKARDLGFEKLYLFTFDASLRPYYQKLG